MCDTWCFSLVLTGTQVFTSRKGIFLVGFAGNTCIWWQNEILEENQNDDTNVVLHNPFHYCFLVLYHDKGANLKLPEIKLFRSFSFPCAPTVTLRNDTTRFQTELISQGCKCPEQGGGMADLWLQCSWFHVWFAWIPCTSYSNQRTHWDYSNGKKIKECACSDFLPAQTRPEILFVSAFQVGVYPAIVNVKWKQRWAFTIHSEEV